jgi:hypothetical protein
MNFTRRAFAQLLLLIPSRRTIDPIDKEAELLAANERLSSTTLRVWRWTGRYWQMVLFESDKLNVRFNDEGVLTHTVQTIGKRHG